MTNETNVPTPEPAQPKKEKRRGFRLFKRDDAGRTIQPDAPGYKDRPYYFAFEFSKKKYIRCTQCNEADKAQSRARQLYKTIVEAVIRDDQKALDRTKLKQSSSALLGKVINIYQGTKDTPGCAVDANPETRLQNIQGLKLIIRTVFDLAADEDCTDVPIHQMVNETTARKWFEIQNQKAQAATSQGIQLSIKRSANSRYAAARSMFVPKAIAAYKDAGVYHECMTAFSEAFNSFKFSKLPPSIYNAPSDEIIAATLESWLQLEDRNMFLAIGHELAFGMRKGELGQARWNWHTIRAGYPVIDSSVDGDTVTVKNNTGLIQVRALDPFYSQMIQRARAKNWIGQGTEYILTGCDSNREDSVFRAVSEWLRNLGWNTKKTNHALRAYAGSQIAMKYTIYEASGWLRHSTVKVTENHYTYFTKRFKPADLNTIPATWATAEAKAPELRVLPAATA